MNDIVLILGKTSLTWGQVVMGMAALSLVLLLLVTILLLRTRRERALEAAIADERAREMDDKVAELTRIQSEMTGPDADRSPRCSAPARAISSA